MQLMPHLLFLNIKIMLIILVWLHNNRHATANRNAIAGKTDALCRIIGNQTDARQAKISQNLCAHAIITQVRRKAQLHIRLHSIQTGILQRISTNLIRQANAAALLTHINDSAAAILLNHAQSSRQLVAAVAAQAAERITGQALAVYAHQHVLLACHITLDNRHMAQIIEVIFISNNTEVAVLRRQRSLCSTMHHLLMRLAVSHKVSHRDEHQLMLLGKLNQLRRACHMAVIAHNLAADTNRTQACQLAQIHSGFGMTGAHQHAALTRTQRKHMTGTTEIARLHALLSTFLHRIRTLIGRNARRRIHMVDRNGKSSLVIIRILAHHSAELQLVHDFALSRHADEAACLLRHEVDSLRRAKLGSHNQVALVFSVLVVGNEHHLACLDGSDGFFNSIILEFFHFPFASTFLYERSRRSHKAILK